MRVAGTRAFPQDEILGVVCSALLAVQEDTDENRLCLISCMFVVL